MERKRFFQPCITLANINPDAKGVVRILPLLPDGTQLRNIVRGSMKLSTTPEEIRVGILRLSLEVFIDVTDLPNPFEPSTFRGETDLKF